MINLQRIWTITWNVFQEVIRDRLLYALAFYGLLLSLAWWLLPQIAATTENKIFLDLGLGLIDIITTLIAIFVGTNLVHKEIEKRTILILIPKPVSRTEFILGKHLGLSAVMAVLLLGMGVIFLGIITIAKIPVVVPNILTILGFQWIRLLLIIAFTLFFGVFTSPILAFFLGLGVYLLGNSTQYLLQFAKLSENTDFQKVLEFAYLVLPNLSRLDLKNLGIYGVFPPIQVLSIQGIYGLAYTVFVLIMTIFVFSKREF